jgi:ribosomal protein S18 acetylase RimI-like enzyme
VNEERVRKGQQPAVKLAGVKIRHLAKNDLTALEWNGEFRHFRKLYADIYQSSLFGKSVLWVAELSSKEIIGQMFVQLISARLELADGKDRAYIYGFRIKPAYRSQGIGTRMLRMAEVDLKRRGFHFLTLNVGKDNPRARELYERYGFQVKAEDPGEWSYVDDHGERHEVHEPSWRMEKEIG